MTEELPKALAHDWRQLTALVDAYGEKQQIPCRQRFPGPNTWITTDPDRQQIAAEACRSCPALEACRQYGIDHPAEMGVYGGLPLSERRAEARRRKARQE